jgi:dihydroneopterin aldolase
MLGEPRHLVETLAEAVALDLLRGFGSIAEATVQVRKPHVPIASTMDFVAVEVRRTQADLL